MQKRSELPLPLSFSEMFRKLSTYSTKRLSDKTFKMYPNISFQKKKNISRQNTLETTTT